MLKYTTTQVTFREIPDEITLCINISNCPIHCPDCHSKELWGDIGEILYPDTLLRLIEENKGITCVCFMGSGNNIDEVIKLSYLIKDIYGFDFKTALYSGDNKIYQAFDYVKIGSYIKEYGSLDKPTTNQRLFKFNYVEPDGPGFWEDITYKFWRHDTNIS